MGDVLVVEDNPTVCALIDYFLTEAGYTVRAAADGPSALAAAREKAPAAVILDLKLPGMDGREILRRLKDEIPHLPVFVLSAVADFSNWRADLADADGVFAKSANLTSLIQAIDRAVR